MDNIRVFKKALVYLEPFKWSIVILTTLTLIQNIISNSSSYFLGKVVDALIHNKGEIVVYFFVLYTLSRIIPIAVSRVRAIYDIKKLDFDIYNHIQSTTLFKSLKLSLGQLRREHSGFKQDVLKAGENSIDFFYNYIMEEILPTISSLLVALVGLYFIGFNFFITAIIFTIIWLGFGSYANEKIKLPLKKQIENRIARSKTYVDILRSLFFIKFSNQKETAIKHLGKVQDDFRNHGVKIWVDFNMRMIFSDILLILFYISFVYFAYTGFLNNQLTAGQLIPIFTWMSALTTSLYQVRNFQRRSTIALSDLKKMFDMLEQKSDVDINPQARSIKKFEDKIVFESVSFDYQEGKKGALTNVNFEIKKGEKVALVGRSGSGKTTIVSLLLRLYDPVSGTLLIDGVDLKSLVLEDWHDMIAYVQQDGDLLDISIKENILFGAKHKVTDEEIESVLEKAGIKEFIHNLPKGIDTLVGERGIKLSGGQKQRVCIARALIKDAPILLLDEATSSLDSETESIVNTAIWEMLGDKTGVVIAHRLSTILDADKIIVMDHGEIVGIGTHKQLLKTTPYYKKLVDAQNVNL